MTDFFVLRSWSETDTATLKQMWWDGASAGVICKSIGGARNPRAVVEKAARMGFTRNPELKLHESPSLFEVPQFMLPTMRVGGELVTIANVRINECRWIEADEPTIDAPLCGRPTEKGSWCPYHRTRAFSKLGA